MPRIDRLTILHHDGDVEPSVGSVTIKKRNGTDRARVKVTEHLDIDPTGAPVVASDAGEIIYTGEVVNADEKAAYRPKTYLWCTPAELRDD